MPTLQFRKQYWVNGTTNKFYYEEWCLLGYYAVGLL
jgi:hypothetical protein